MPRRRKPARLWTRRARKDKHGNQRRGVIVVLDDGRHIPTGCFEGEDKKAERFLAQYIAEKYQPQRSRRGIDHIDVADVLSIYFDYALTILRARHGVAEEFEDRIVAVRQLKGRIDRLNEFWGGTMLSDVNGDTCRGYAKGRSPGSARRELQDLAAAIGHHLREGFHRELVKVPLPDRGPPRQRWLTRREAAALLWVCWRYRELQRRVRGEDAAEALPTAKYPLRHLARFILIGLYTGTRAAAISAASPAAKKAGRSSISTPASTTGLPKGRPRRINVSRRYRCRAGYWRICVAGAIKAWLSITSSNGTAARSIRSKRRWHQPCAWPACRLSTATSRRIRFGTRLPRGLCRQARRSGKRLAFSA